MLMTETRRSDLPVPVVMNGFLHEGLEMEVADCPFTMRY